MTLLVACGGAPPPKHTTVASRHEATARAPARAGSEAKHTAKAAPAPAKAKGHRATLRYELGGQAFPLPVVHGSIGGEPTWMLVDTGANSHVVAGWLARKAHLTSKDHGDVGTDHTGRAITTARIERPRIALDEWGALDDAPVLVTEVPDAVARLGIGAFISPQQLGGGRAVVLDLARGELRASDSVEPPAAFDDRGIDPFEAGSLVCDDRESAIPGLAFVVPAKIEGRTVALLLDTGAHHTDLLTSTAVGQKLVGRSVANKEQVYAASGRVTTRTLKKARLQVGRLSTVTDVDLIPGATDASCPRDGVLAMDILRSCVLVLTPSRLYGRCGD